MAVARTNEALSRFRRLKGLPPAILTLRIYLVFAAIVATLLVVHGFGIAHFRHDGIPYNPESLFASKMLEEGRWINFGLYPVLRLIEPHLAYFACFALIAAGLFELVRRFVPGRVAPAAMVATLMVYPGLYEQMLWPVTTLPAAAVFAVSAFLVGRVSWWFVLPAGIAQFATIPLFYYLLPLALLPPERTGGARGPAVLVLRGVVWGLGLVAGYLVAALANQVVFDHFGIRIAAWREPHPATDFASLLANARMSAMMAWDHLRQWLPPISLIGVGLLYALAFLRGLQKGQVADRLVRLGFALMVAGAIYLAVLPAGILVAARSLLPVAAGVVLLPFLVGPVRLAPVFAAGMAIFVGVPSAVEAVSISRYVAGLTGIHARMVERGIPRAGPAYRGVVIDMPYPERFAAGVTAQLPRGLHRSEYTSHFEGPWRVAPAFVEAGFRDYQLCGEPGASPALCGLIANAVALGACEAEPAQMCVIGEEDGWLLIQLRQ